MTTYPFYQYYGKLQQFIYVGEFAVPNDAPTFFAPLRPTNSPPHNINSINAQTLQSLRYERVGIGNSTFYLAHCDVKIYGN